MIRVSEQTILLVSDDVDLWAAARREWESKDESLRVATVSTLDAARRIIEHAAPSVIVLEVRSIFSESEGRLGKAPDLSSVVSWLAQHAPVVVIGAAEQQLELAPLVTAGAADFVERGRDSLPAALQRVERRLHQAQLASAQAQEFVNVTDSSTGEGFGAVLRHEMNNPLTGILGNAELLLAELKRQKDGKLPNGGRTRLETIAALAVRLRETVRRLSQEWEARRP